MEKIYADTSPQLLSIYPPPCMDDDDEACSCHDIAAEWLTGYILFSIKISMKKLNFLKNQYRNFENIKKSLKNSVSNKSILNRKIIFDLSAFETIIFRLHLDLQLSPLDDERGSKYKSILSVNFYKSNSRSLPRYNSKRTSTMFQSPKSVSLTPFFIGESVLCATNTVIRSFFGQAILCSFCSPETQHFHKNNSFSFFQKSRNPRCKSRSFIGIHCNY